MSDNEFAPAGWMAITGAILTLPLMGMGIVLDIISKKVSMIHPLFPILYVGFGMLSWVDPDDGRTVDSRLCCCHMRYP